MLRINSTLTQALFISAFMTVILLPNSVFADTMEGSLNGEPHSWHVLKQGNSSTASYSELSPNMLTVTLQGHAEQQFATQGTVSINFTMMNGELISPPEVSYFHTGRFMPNYGSQETPEHWELSVSNIDGDSAHFVGRYKNTLVLQGKPVSDEPDSVDLVVEFDLRASKENL